MDTATWEIILGACIGIGLAAACGFRVFVPMFVISIAAHSGHLTLSESFSWIDSLPAVIAFGAATALEIAGYYIPWVDNLLDTVSAPAAVVAGTIVTAACIVDVDPMLQWSLAIIAGGGAAGAISAGTSTVRATSSLTTAGLGNFAIATTELGLSALTSVLSLVVPLVTVIGVLLMLCVAVHILLGRSKRSSADAANVVQ